jgi:hypothetical protein
VLGRLDIGLLGYVQSLEYMVNIVRVHRGFNYSLISMLQRVFHEEGICTFNFVYK